LHRAYIPIHRANGANGAEGSATASGATTIFAHRQDHLRDGRASSRFELALALREILREKAILFWDNNRFDKFLFSSPQ